MTSAAQGRRSAKSAPKDLATMVRDKTLKAVTEGRLKPTLQHGLMAQSMLDKRAERAADRQLAIRLAAMLAGQAPPPGIINVTPRDDDDDDEAFDPDDLAQLGPG
jgi:hypothetical protein